MRLADKYNAALGEPTGKRCAVSCPCGGVHIFGAEALRAGAMVRPPGARVGNFTLGPHQNMFLVAIAPRIYSDDEVEELKHGSKKLLYVFGTVTYEDTFGVSRYTKLCQVIVWFADGSPSTRNYGSFNESN